MKQSKVTEPMLQHIASRFKALGEPNRLRLLMALSKDEKSVTDLVQETGIEQTNASRHLQLLERAGILTRRKEGLCVYYRVTDPYIFDICETVCGSARGYIKDRIEALKR